MINVQYPMINDQRNVLGVIILLRSCANSALDIEY